MEEQDAMDMWITVSKDSKTLQHEIFQHAQQHFHLNILSATKFIKSMIKKEGSNFDVVCVHDWLSSITGMMIKNEAKIPIAFHVHSTE